MPPCPSCHGPAPKRDGHDPSGRQRDACHACRRDFTARSAPAFAGYRWPAGVIVLAVRWSLSHPLSATSVMELLAERGVDVSKRPVLRWGQHFGPRLAAEIRKHRRPSGTKGYVDEAFFFRGTDKHYLYRAEAFAGRPRRPGLRQVVGRVIALPARVVRPVGGGLTLLVPPAHPYAHCFVPPPPSRQLPLPLLDTAPCDAHF
jgi:transposase-like protein